ncbi:MAG: hypothetical protein WBG62_13410, partial [Cyclobacteriaceae bacterium]
MIHFKRLFFITFRVFFFTKESLPDLKIRAANWEAANGSPGVYSAADLDADNLPNWLEDVDGDGYPNFLDPPATAFYRDSDNDGLVDLFDNDHFGVAMSSPDTNSDLVPDYREADPVIILPVQLLYFRGEYTGGAAALSWKTAAEEHNDYFTIERSADGLNFTRLATVAGYGTSSTPVEYDYTDQSPAYGNNYYRLSQTDMDGTTEYLETILVRVLPAQARAVLSLYP